MVLYISSHTYHFQYSSALSVGPSFHLVPFDDAEMSLARAGDSFSCVQVSFLFSE